MNSETWYCVKSEFSKINFCSSYFLAQIVSDDLVQRHKQSPTIFNSKASEKIFTWHTERTPESTEPHRTYILPGKIKLCVPLYDLDRFKTYVQNLHQEQNYSSVKKFVKINGDQYCLALTLYQFQWLSLLIK